MTTATAHPRHTKGANTSAALAAVAMLLLILGGGYFAWRSYANRVDPASKDLVDLQMTFPVGLRRTSNNVGGFPGMGRGPRQQQNNNFRQQPNNRQNNLNIPDAIRPSGPGRFFIKSGSITLNVNRAGTDWNYNWTYALNEVLTPDQLYTVSLRTLLTRNVPAATAKGVTADQLKKIGDLPQINVTLTPDEAANVKTEFSAWYAAAGGTNAANGPAVLPQSNSQPAKAAEQKLLATLDAISKSQASEMKSRYQDLIAQLQGILGAEMITKLKNGG